MLRLSLNGQWVMRKSTNKVPDKEGQNTAECISKGVPGRIPGSVYSFLLGSGLMEDPYYRDRELDALRLMEDDYTFSREFAIDPSAGILPCVHQRLRFDGIDTLSEVRLNGVLLGLTDNMHITWQFDVKGVLREGKNTLEVTILSPTRFIRNADREYHLGGSYESMRGFPHLRKAHCMFGWDWGPRLPDMGIFRDVILLGFDQARIDSVYVTQIHEKKKPDALEADKVTLQMDVQLQLDPHGIPAGCPFTSTEARVSSPWQRSRTASQRSSSGSAVKERL